MVLIVSRYPAPADRIRPGPRAYREPSQPTCSPVRDDDDAEVELRGGLVGDQDRRLLGEADRDPHALELAAGEGAQGAVGEGEDREPTIVTSTRVPRAASRAPSSPMCARCTYRSALHYTALRWSQRKTRDTEDDRERVARRTDGVDEGGAAGQERIATTVAYVLTSLDAVGG